MAWRPARCPACHRVLRGEALCWRCDAAGDEADERAPSAAPFTERLLDRLEGSR